MENAPKEPVVKNINRTSKGRVGQIDHTIRKSNQDGPNKEHISH